MTRRPSAASILSVPGREPRGALEVDLAVDERLLRVIVTHFGLRRYERAEQAARIFARLSECVGQPIVILGDFNEWRPDDPSMRLFHARFGRSRLRTFPSRRPLFAIDRVMVEPQSLLVETRVHRSALARVASDHLPMRAVIDLARLRDPADRGASLPPPPDR
jgi:endonuclease/exonuclease/phosphatase family metal-dependent hydrolase